jgi:hypothetical protein
VARWQSTLDIHNLHLVDRKSNSQNADRNSRMQTAIQRAMYIDCHAGDHCGNAKFIEYVARLYCYVSSQTSEQRKDEIYIKYLGIFLRPSSIKMSQASLTAQEGNHIPCCYLPPGHMCVCPDKEDVFASSLKCKKAGV